MSNPNPNASEFKSRVGLDDLYIAQITQDDASGYVVGTPFYLAPAVEATIKNNVTQERQYADDGVFDNLDAEGVSEIEMTLTGVPAETQALINGDQFDAATGRVFDNADPALAPDFALGFRSKKTNGSYRYFWYLKGRFSKADEEFATEKDKREAKTPKVKFSAVKTIHEFTAGGETKTRKRVYGDEDTTNFDATGWLTEVQTPETTAYSALALSSSSPVDEATGVAVGGNITLTFNNALQPGAINNVMILDENFDPVAAVNTLSTSLKVITINPTGNLDAATTFYVVITGVTDIYGQTLTDQVSFTTAA